MSVNNSSHILLIPPSRFSPTVVLYLPLHKPGPPESSWENEFASLGCQPHGVFLAALVRNHFMTSVSHRLTVLSV